MNFIQLCEERYDKVKSILCVGLDPVIEKFPVKNNDIEASITAYFSEIIENFSKYIFIVKPNVAFYEQYGLPGYKALKNVIKKAKEFKIPVILDAKRGDIGNTSNAYAKACFDDLEADAVTLSPYLGEDSLSPFFEYKDKGFFVLGRTSNPGSADLQMLKLDNGDCLYTHVIKKVIGWNKKYTNGIGVVAGATHFDELKNIIELLLQNSGMPVLIPGVGKQGGDFNSIIEFLKEKKYPLHKVFINSSSKIIFAHQDNPGLKYMDAIETEIKKMMIT